MTQDATTSGTAREMLRHALATLAYRGGKAVRGSTDHFAEFKTEATIRTPGQILAHIGDLLDWALSLADGRHAWHDSAPRPWPEEVERLFEALREQYIERDRPRLHLLPEAVEKAVVAGSSPRERARLVCDWLASLTDRAAFQAHQRMFDTSSGSAPGFV